jgi:hypothetical protein
MKTEVKTPVILAVVVVFLAGFVYWGYGALAGVGSLDKGQVNYTPGKPPWLEKDASKKVSGASASTMPGAPQVDNRPK